MRGEKAGLFVSVWDWLRAVVAALLQRFWRGPEGQSAELRLKAMSGRSQAVIVVCVLALLFVCALIAAEFGWVGMLVYFLAVIVLVN